jgi:hypothetical protein
LIGPEGVAVGEGVDTAELAADGRFQHLVTFLGQAVPVPLES